MSANHDEHPILIEFKNLADIYVEAFNSAQSHQANRIIKDADRLLKKIDKMNLVDTLAKNLHNEDIKIKFFVALILIHSDKYKDTAINSLREVEKILPVGTAIKGQAGGLVSLYEAKNKFK